MRPLCSVTASFPLAVVAAGNRIPKASLSTMDVAIKPALGVWPVCTIVRDYSCHWQRAAINSPPQMLSTFPVNQNTQKAKIDDNVIQNKTRIIYTKHVAFFFLFFLSSFSSFFRTFFCCCCCCRCCVVCALSCRCNAHITLACVTSYFF